MGTHASLRNEMTATEEARRSPLVEFIDVSKRFGRVQALRGISFRAHAGECVALVGPNGAGKTTAFRVLARLIRKDAGVVLVNGVDLRESHTPVGVLIENPAYYPYLTVQQNLEFAASVARVPESTVRRVQSDVGLDRVRSQAAGALSHGMRQRLGLAMALLPSAPIVLLDEPLTGLDPESQRHTRDLLAAERSDGRGLILSTHNLSEVEELANFLVFLKAGVVLASGSVVNLQQTTEAIVRTDRVQLAIAALDASGYKARWTRKDELVVRLGTSRPEKITEVLAVAGIYPNAITPRTPSLEEMYLKIMGEHRDQPTE